MLTHIKLLSDSISHVKFISYDGKYPNLCRGKLTLEIDGEKVTFSPPVFFKPNNSMYRSFWSSGGGLNPNYEGTYQGEWVIDIKEIPEQYRKYAYEIDRVFNKNVEYGCCGGCI